MPATRCAPPHTDKRSRSHEAVEAQRTGPSAPGRHSNQPCLYESHTSESPAHQSSVHELFCERTAPPASAARRSGGIPLDPCARFHGSVLPRPWTSRLTASQHATTRSAQSRNCDHLCVVELCTKTRRAPIDAATEPTG